MDQLESDVTEPEQANDEAVLPREAYALLAQANLLRMRGHWEEAAQKCMAALRLAPDSSSANSLLGDIYENQGRLDDAAQWYRMALDVNPNSPADRLKLGRLSRRDEVQASKAANRPARLAAAASENTSASLISQIRLREALRDPEILLRYGAIVAALGLVLAVACAYAVVHHTSSLSTLGLGGEAVVKSTPVVVPPLAGVLPTDPDAVSVRDPSEQSLLTALQGSHVLSALGIAVYDVQVDPRISGMTVTFGLPAAGRMTQAELAHDAFRVLQTATGSGQAADRFTARCILVPSAGNTAATLAFVGDTSRETLLPLAAAGSGVTDVQAEAVFTNVWWSTTADIGG
ncbi:MAG: tetratricopeptide repeat protein [Janthinobacterium lividum]